MFVIGFVLGFKERYWLMNLIFWLDILLGLGRGGGFFVVLRWNMIVLIVLLVYNLYEENIIERKDVLFIIKV